MKYSAVLKFYFKIYVFNAIYHKKIIFLSRVRIACSLNSLQVLKKYSSLFFTSTALINYIVKTYS